VWPVGLRDGAFGGLKSLRLPLAQADYISSAPRQMQDKNDLKAAVR